MSYIRLWVYELEEEWVNSHNSMPGDGNASQKGPKQGDSIDNRFQNSGQDVREIVSLCCCWFDEGGTYMYNFRQSHSG